MKLNSADLSVLIDVVEGLMDVVRASRSEHSRMKRILYELKHEREIVRIKQRGRRIRRTSGLRS